MSEQKNIPNQTFDNFIVSRSNKKSLFGLSRFGEQSPGKVCCDLWCKLIRKDTSAICDKQCTYQKKTRLEDLLNKLRRLDFSVYHRSS